MMLPSFERVLRLGLSFVWLDCFASATSFDQVVWTLTSPVGGGYAGQARYYAGRQQLILTGTVWDSEFLEHSAWHTSLGRRQERKVSEGLPAHGFLGDSQCFLASLNVSSSDVPNALPTWTTALQSQAPPHACGTAMALREQDTAAQLLVLGYERLPDPIHTDWTTRVQQSLTLWQVHPDNLVPASPLTTTFSLYQNEFHPTNTDWTSVPSQYHHQSDSYIYSMEAVPGEAPDTVFVAVTQSETVPSWLYNIGEFAPEQQPDDETLHSQWYQRQLSLVPELANGASTASWRVPIVTGGVQHIDADHGTVLWYTKFTYGQNTAPGHVMVTNVAYFPNTQDGASVLVGGSTQASGSLLGTAVTGIADQWDGFVTKLKADNGELWTGDAQQQQDASIRIKSSQNRHDWVVAICGQGSNHAYIVGTTQGSVVSGGSNNDGGAFVMRLNVDTMTIEWTVQLPGMGVVATACAMDPQEPSSLTTTKNLLYVAGVLPVGHAGWTVNGTLQTTTSSTSRSSQDAFVVAIDVDHIKGQVEWIHELDFSEKQESITSLSLDDHHVWAYGNSYDSDTQENQVFVVALDREAVPKQNEDGSPVPQEEEADNKDDDNDSSAVVVAIMVPLVVLVVVASGLAILLKRRAHNQTTKDDWQTTMPQHELKLQEQQQPPEQPKDDSHTYSGESTERDSANDDTKSIV